MQASRFASRLAIMPKRKATQAAPASKRSKSTPVHSKTFDYDQDFDNTDFREHPELYMVGRGEQGVLSVQPYKSEIGQHWRFKDPEVAQQSADKILQLYEQYKAAEPPDFVGMDCARKFLQMGYTRAMRYANHKGGRKYDKQSGAELPKQELLDPTKLASAQIFKPLWKQVEADSVYQQLRQHHQETHEKPRKAAAKAAAQAQKAPAKA